MVWPSCLAVLFRSLSRSVDGGENGVNQWSVFESVEQLYRTGESAFVGVALENTYKQVAAIDLKSRQQAGTGGIGSAGLHAHSFPAVIAGVAF